IRHDPNNELKKAYIVEVVDKLPNIRYRINNRWLYADISDALEPAVRDREYFSETTLTQGLEALYEEYNVRPVDRTFPVYHDKERYGLLLFKVYTGSGGYRHIPILISRDNRVRVTRFYNFLSERLPYFVENSINTQSVFRMVNVTDIDVLQDD